MADTDDWVAGPGLFRATVAPAGLVGWAAAWGVWFVVLGTIAGGLVWMTAADAVDVGWRQTGPVPAGLAVLFGWAAVRAGVRFVRVCGARGRALSVAVEGGVLTLVDPTRPGRPTRFAAASLTDVRVSHLVRSRFGDGWVWVRVETADGRLASLAFLAADARLGSRLEAELRRAVQLT